MSEPGPIFYIKQGDHLPVITATLRLRGRPVDLTGATVRFKMRLKTAADADASKVNAAAIIVGAATLAAVEYDWTGTDTDTLGSYNGEWMVNYGGTVMHFPNDRWLSIEVVQKLP